MMLTIQQNTNVTKLIKQRQFGQYTWYPRANISDTTQKSGHVAVFSWWRDERQTGLHPKRGAEEETNDIVNKFEIVI